MFVFIRIKHQFYYIAKQDVLLRNARTGYTRRFKLASVFSRWVPKYTFSVKLAKIVDVLNFEAKQCVFMLNSQVCEHFTHHCKW